MSRPAEPEFWGRHGPGGATAMLVAGIIALVIAIRKRRRGGR